MDVAADNVERMLTETRSESLQTVSAFCVNLHFNADLRVEVNYGIFQERYSLNHFSLEDNLMLYYHLKIRQPEPQESLFWMHSYFLVTHKAFVAETLSRSKDLLRVARAIHCIIFSLPVYSQ